MLKNSPTNAGDITDAGSIPGWEDPLQEGILAWEIPWTEEPDGPQSIGSQRVGYD